MSGWIPICRVDDIPVLGARRVARPRGMDVAVFRNDRDEVFALLDRCPHKAGPLSQGIVFGTSVACPLHNWTIGLEDGCAKAPDEGRAQRFSVKVEGGQIYLDALELAGLTVDAEKPIAGPLRRHPCEGGDTKSTRHPREGGNAKSTRHPCEGGDTKSTRHPREGGDAKSTRHPREGGDPEHPAD